jgi:cold shock CspA family protein
MAESPSPSNDRRSEGEMVWFNSAKDVGLIETTDGERLRVPGTAFRNGSKPKGRCAGQAVTFLATGTGATASAEDVAFVSEDAPRRARIRRSGAR